MTARRSALCCVLLGSLVVGCGGGTTAASSPGPSVTPEKKAERAEPAPKESPHPKAPEVEAAPESVVQVSFEPLVTGVLPGGKFLVAARFRMAPGYRISWKVAGDVGQPTAVEFRAPAGFEVGPAQFPAPAKYPVPGGYTSYGYERETAVFAEVRAPASIRGGAVHRFDMDARWVACKKQCSSEHTSAFVEIPTAFGAVAAKDVEASLEPFRKRLPKPLSDVRDAAQEWAVGGQGATLVVKLPGAAVRDFFSDATADPAPTKATFGEGEARFDYDDAPKPGSRPLRGVLVAGPAGAEEFFDLEATLPDPEGKTKGKGKR